MRPIRVGLNLVAVAEGGGGIARYGVELALALAARPDVEPHLFTSLDAPAALYPPALPDGVRVTRLPVHLAGPPIHLLAQFLAVPALSMARRLDVVHTVSNAGPVQIPGVASVITFHDTTWLTAPGDWGPPAAVRAMRRVAAPTTRRADRVLVGSHAAAQDLKTLLGIPPDRIDVAHHGVSAVFGVEATPEAPLRERLGLGDDPVILCVAQKRPYKNQEVLVRALADPRTYGTRLVLPGAPTEYEEVLRRMAAELGVEHRVHLLPWVDDRDMEGLYRIARCFVLPSRLEGFGLPILEAMARGLPVACSDRSAMPEVAGDAALLFDPDDDGQVADAVVRLLDDQSLRDDLAARGRERAAQFTWEATAQATIESYTQALSRPVPTGAGTSLRR